MKLEWPTGVDGGSLCLALLQRARDADPDNAVDVLVSFIADQDVHLSLASLDAAEGHAYDAIDACREVDGDDRTRQDAWLYAALQCRRVKRTVDKVLALRQSNPEFAHPATVTVVWLLVENGQQWSRADQLAALPPIPTTITVGRREPHLQMTFSVDHYQLVGNLKSLGTFFGFLCVAGKGQNPIDAAAMRASGFTDTNYSLQQITT